MHRREGCQSSKQQGEIFVVSMADPDGSEGESPSDGVTATSET